MRFERRNKKKIIAALDMTPLITVVLKLVLFFMLSSTFVVQASIPIEVSQSNSATQLEQKELSITLAFGEGGPDNQGKIYIDMTEIADWGGFSRVLAEFHAAQPDASVLIRPDARVTTARLIRVLGIANNLGIQHYGIAARPPKEGE